MAVRPSPGQNVAEHLPSPGQNVVIISPHRGRMWQNISPHRGQKAGESLMLELVFVGVNYMARWCAVFAHPRPHYS